MFRIIFDLIRQKLGVTTSQEVPGCMASTIRYPNSNIWNRSKANESLAKLRKGDPFYGTSVMNIRNAIENGSITLAELGTTETELQKLSRGGSRIIVGWKLNDLSSPEGDTCAESHYRDILEEMAKFGFTWAEFGKTEDEIWKLRKRGAKRNIEQWLAQLREGSEHYENFLSFLQQTVALFAFSLKELGTSNEELKVLRKKGCQTKARLWLVALKNRYNWSEEAIPIILRELYRGGLKPEDIGTTKDELQSFRLDLLCRCASCQNGRRILESLSESFRVPLKV